MSIALDLPGRPSPGRVARRAMLPLLAMLGMLAGHLVGWRGVDLPSAVHRTQLFHQVGFTLWDGSWYGGQWVLSYSVLLSPVGALLGLTPLAVVAAGLSTLSFRAVVSYRAAEAHQAAESHPAAHSYRSGLDARGVTVATAAFAVGTIVAGTVGQVPFLTAEAFVLAALAFAQRGRWPLAWALAATASLFSPLAGFFLDIAVAAWFFDTVLDGGWRAERGRALRIAGVGAGASAPILATTILFPGEGAMPFPGLDVVWYLLIAAGLAAVTVRSQRMIRLGLVVFALAVAGSFVVASPIGGNVGRAEDSVALPLAVVLLWGRSRRLLALAAVPVALTSWSPAWTAVSSIPAEPSAHQAFYRPVVAWLERADAAGLDGRIEVVPTAAHWETVWVGDVLPIARGWERQSDATLNPIFYDHAPLDPARYRAWLLTNGVRFVAVSDAPPDYAARREVALLGHPLAGLTPVWRNHDWRVYAVDRSTGIVEGPAQLTEYGNATMALRVTRPGPVLVRVHYSEAWRVTGGACVTGDAGGWLGLRATRSGPLTLRLAVSGPSSACPTAAA